MIRRTGLVHRSVVSAGVLLLAAGCGGGAPSSGPSVTPSQAESSPSVHGEPITGPLPCTPHGTTLTITAELEKFSTDCLAAPKEESFRIRFTNEESVDAPIPGAVRHNIGIYSSTSAEQEIFAGSVTSPTERVVYRVTALPRGLYYFRCDIHPSVMHGTFVVA
jgi:hypothetical protein